MPVAASNVPYSKRRIKYPQPSEYVDRVRQERMYLINIWTISLTVQRTHGNYWIQGCKEGEPYTCIQLSGRVEEPDLGNDESAQILQPAKEIAADLEHEFNGNIYMPADAPPSFLGVFVSNTPTPTEKRLDQAREQLKEFAHAVVAQADIFWDDPKNHVLINEFHRRFAKLLDVKRPWLYEAKALKPCPACSAPISAGLAKCPSCHAVLDMDKLKQYFPLDYAELQALKAESKKTPKEA